MKKNSRLKLLGYIPKCSTLGYWKSNDGSMSVLKTKKAAKEYTEFIRAYFKSDVKYIKVFIEE